MIIPTYNSAPYLRRCIESVFQQSHRPVQVIVVDDGSTDDTRNILDELGSDVLALFADRQGPYVCRNLGARHATGDWLAFLDADDFWEPEKLSAQLAVAAARGVPLVYTDRYNIGERADLPLRQSEHQVLREGRVFEALLTKGNVITTSSALLRRDVFEALGGFDVSYPRASDWHMWLRIADQYEIGLCPEALVHYRLHKGNISRDTRLVSRSRLGIVGYALGLPSARSFSAVTRRRVWSETWRQNGWDDARHGRFARAAGAYLRALLWWPLNGAAAAGLLKAFLRAD